MKFRRPTNPLMRSPVVKRSLRINGRNTSVTLEDGFWNALKEIAAVQEVTVQELILKAKTAGESRNLSSSIRLFVLDHYRQHAAARRR